MIIFHVVYFAACFTAFTICVLLAIFAKSILRELGRPEPVVETNGNLLRVVLGTAAFGFMIMGGLSLEYIVEVIG